MCINSSAGHFRKPVCKSTNCGLKVLVCGFANRFLTANICGFAVKKLKSTANPQINSITEIVSAISKKKTFIRFSVSTDLGWCISPVQHPLTKFLCCGTIISQRCYYSYSKMSFLTAKNTFEKKWVGLRSRNFQRLVLVKKNLDFLKWQRVALDDFDDMPTMFSR